MKLVRISLNNFRQYQSVDIEFSAGLIGITGSNGAGKTTLIEAITFALYGTKAVRGKIEDLKTKGINKEKVSVELSFSIGAGIYRILRTTTDAKFFVAGESEAGITGSREVTNQVVKILGMNLEEFSATFLTEQKGLEFLSGKKGATEREKFIVRMMGFDRLETLQDELREQRKERKQKVLGFEAGLGDRFELETRLQGEKESLDNLQKKLQEKTTILEQVKLRADEERKKFEILEKEFTLYRARREALTVSQTRFEEATKRLKHLDDRSKEIDTTVVFEKPFRTYREDAAKNPDANTEKIIYQIKSRISSLEEKIVAVTANRSKFQTDRQVARARVEEKLIVLSKQQVGEQKKLANYEGLKKSGAPCPTCGQLLGDNIKKVIGDISKEIEKLSTLIQQEKLALESFLQPSAEEQDLILHFEDISKALTEEKKSLPQCDLLQNLVNESTLIRTQQESLRNELITLDELLRVKRKELSELTFSDALYTASKTSLAASESMVSVARSDKLMIEGDFKTVQSQVERTTEALLVYDQKQAGLKSLRKELLVFDEADITLTEFRKSVNESIRPRIAELASEFLSELTEGRYNEVFMGVDFAPTVYDAGEIKSVISGGETDILHLCVRLALSQLLAERAGQTFNLLILDEVFGSLDTQRRQNVLQLLEKLSERFEQIIIITHMDDIRDAVDAVLDVRFNPDTGTAEVTEGEMNEYYI
jgi:exonuclease SbcC